MTKKCVLIASALALAMPLYSFAGGSAECSQSEPSVVVTSSGEAGIQASGRSVLVTSNTSKSPDFFLDKGTSSDRDYGKIQATDITILPERTTSVEMSNSDVNRIACSGPIEDLIYSSEKGVEGNFVGDNAFIKFKIAKKGAEKIYSSTPTELFVACQGKIFSLIATPKRIPAATIRLFTGRDDAQKKNMAELEGMPFEKKILHLLKQAYKAKYPDSYLTHSANLKIELASNLDVRLRHVVDVEGEGFRIKEFVVSSRGGQVVELEEKLFLSRNIGEKIVAIAIDEHLLKSGKSTRVFVIEARGEAES